MATLNPDDYLGRDYFFHRPGENLTSITIIAYDPVKGWQLACRGTQAVWVPSEMLLELFEEGILQ